MTEKLERLAKVMALAGIASRRQSEVLIEAGRVFVNGEKVQTCATCVNPKKDKISVDGKIIQPSLPFKAWIYHKPKGVITTHYDPEQRETVFDVAKKAGLPYVVSVGRLDINSEGLLILTNKGEFAHFAESPKTGWKRCYRVRVFGEIDHDKLMSLKKGITINEIRYKFLDIDIDTLRSGQNKWLTITLTEGKNREIRTVLEHIGLQVNRLIRVSYGPFELGSLKPDEIKAVPKHELEKYPF